MQVGSPKSSLPKPYKKFKLPFLNNNLPQPSLSHNQSQFCAKIIQNFKKCVSKSKLNQKQSPTYQNHIESDNRHKQDNWMFLKKLKLISLIKGDRESITTIPIYGDYSPYKRRASSQFSRKIDSERSKKDSGLKKRNKTEVNYDLMVRKANMNINLGFLPKPKENPMQFISCRQQKSHKRSLTQQVARENKIVSGRKSNQSIGIQFPFMTNPDIINNEQQNSQQPQQIQKCLYKLKSIRTKHTIKLTSNQYNSNCIQKIHQYNERMLMNTSVRGWTRYAKLNQLQIQHHLGFAQLQQ